jgi:hypothetical protein
MVLIGLMSTMVNHHSTENQSRQIGIMPPQPLSPVYDHASNAIDAITLTITMQGDGTTGDNR